MIVVVAVLCVFAGSDRKEDERKEATAPTYDAECSFFLARLFSKQKRNGKICDYDYEKENNRGDDDGRNSVIDFLSAGAERALTMETALTVMMVSCTLVFSFISAYAVAFAWQGLRTCYNFTLLKPRVHHTVKRLYVV